jgi:hypothetical protein
LFACVGEIWPGAIVRRNGWKIGNSEIWYVTIVLDESNAARDFTDWLSLNAKRVDFRRRIGRPENASAYSDDLLHEPGSAY